MSPTATIKGSADEGDPLEGGGDTEGGAVEAGTLGSGEPTSEVEFCALHASHSSSWVSSVSGSVCEDQAYPRYPSMRLAFQRSNISICSVGVGTR